MTEAYVLVDWDNLLPTTKARPLSQVADHLAQAIYTSWTNVSDLTAITIRLYDGWYDDHNLTQRAQTLIAQTLADFPRPFVGAQRATSPVRVSAALARSLLCDPTHHLTHTFRRRCRLRHSTRSAIDPSDCALPMACELQALRDAINNDRCPSARCPASPIGTLAADQQKLVDTMLVADALHLATASNARIVVVSSDDDVIPALIAATSLDRPVLLLHTRPSRSIRVSHLPRRRANFVQANLGG